MEQDKSPQELQRGSPGPLGERESLGMSERLYRALFDEAPDAMFVVDLGGKVLAANAAALRGTGYSEEEAETLTIFKFFSPAFSERLSKQLKEAVDGLQPGPAEYKLVAKDGGGSWVDVELRTVNDASKPVGVQVIARDISSRRTDQEALKCYRENLERVLNALPDSALLESPDHVIQFINNAARALFGNVKGKMCHEALRRLPRPCADCPAEEVVRNRRSVCRATHHHEGKLWEIMALPLLNADGSTSVLEIVKDVTMSRQTEENLKASERLAVLGRVTAEMAHEIKNPLSAITTFAQLLPEKYDDPDFREVFTRTALQAANRIDYLMEELVGFARPLKPVFEETDLREVIDEALMEVHQLFAEKAVRVSTDQSPEPLVVPVDHQQVKRVITELLSNSADAVGDGGNVKISARFIREGGELAPRWLEVVVSDDGRGIPPENLPRVFEPFFTTSTEKLGLGLAIAQRIIEEHSGKIEVKSQPGQGATFTVRLKAE